MKDDYTQHGEIQVKCLKGMGLNNDHGEWFVKHGGELYRKQFPITEETFIADARKAIHEMSQEHKFPLPCVFVS